MRLWFGITAMACGVVSFACGGEPTDAGPAATTAAATGGDANRPPEIVSVHFEPSDPTPDDAVRAVVVAADPDGDPVRLVYEWHLQGRPVGRGTQRLALDGAVRGDPFEVTVVASDGRAESPPTLHGGVIANRPPRVERLAIEPGTEITAGMTIAVRPEGSDEDGDPLTYRYDWLVNGEALDHEQAELDTRSLARGDVVAVSVRAHDGRDASEPLRSPDLHVVNRPPRVVSTPGRSALGGGFHYRVEALDPDGDAPLRFELEDPPAGMKIGAMSGEIDWRPRVDQAGRHTVRVIVDDMKGGRIAHAFEVNVAGDPSGSGESGT